MSSDDRFDWLILGCIALILLKGFLVSGILDLHDQRMDLISADVDWLKDNNAVATTETRA